MLHPDVLDALAVRDTRGSDSARRLLNRFVRSSSAYLLAQSTAQAADALAAQNCRDAYDARTAFRGTRAECAADARSTLRIWSNVSPRPVKG